MQIAFLHLVICMLPGFIYSFILSLEIKKCAQDVIVVNIACVVDWRCLSRWLWTLIKCDQSAVVSFHSKKLHDYEVLQLPYLWCLVLKGRRYAFEIACEENLEAEKHLEKKTSSILYFYALTNGLLSQISSNGVILISVVLLESWQWFT